MAAACNVVAESGGFDPAEIFALLPRWPGLSMFAAPTMVKRLVGQGGDGDTRNLTRSEEHTFELQSLMRISYAVFCLKIKTINIPYINNMNTYLLYIRLI